MKIWKVEEAINNELNYVTSLNRVKSIPISLKEEVKPQNGQQKASKRPANSSLGSPLILLLSLFAIRFWVSLQNKVFADAEQNKIFL